MDPATAPSNPSPSDDMVIKLQKQLELLKKQRNQEETQTIANYKQQTTSPLNDISAEDILHAFSQGKQKSDHLQPSAPDLTDDQISAEDILHAFNQGSQPVAGRQSPVSDTNGLVQTAGPTDPVLHQNNLAVSQASSSNAHVGSIVVDPGVNPVSTNPVSTTTPGYSDTQASDVTDIDNTKQTVKILEPAQPVGSVRKESLQGSSIQEKIQFQEISTELGKDAELEKWVEEVPDAKTVTLPKPVQDDYGQILVQASQIPKPNIVLPISEPEMEKALHHKVVDSFRWLYEWARRLILLQPGRVFYNNDKNN